MDIKNQKEMEEISKKYEIKFENDSILLLQNRYCKFLKIYFKKLFYNDKIYIKGICQVFSWWGLMIFLRTKIIS